MPKKTALCIGINNYPGTQNDLNGCVNDANDWTAELKARGFTVSQLLDEKATRANILKALKSLMTSTQAGDSVVVQYSGHGSFVPDENGDETDGSDECICPYDIVKPNGKANFITDDELYDVYSLRHRASKLVVISDSCHSGTVAKAGPVLGNDTVVRKKRFLEPAVFLSAKQMAQFGNVRIKNIRTASKPGRYAGLLLAGCQDYQVSYDANFANRANGAFTYVALQTLKKLPKNKNYSDWFKAIRKKLPSQDYDQIPNLNASSSMKLWKVFS